MQGLPSTKPPPSAETRTSALPHSDIEYRPDVDGLRAVAVLAVVAYHAFPNVLRGGLIGVDIFFVISGFLITSIIARNLAADRFSFVDFYVRRIKRIFPALILMLAACLGMGWYALYDVEYEPLGRHVAGGAAFISNFVLASESGYFDSEGQYKELLHLWSLGVEEQFYLFFPIVVALCWKLPRALLPTILLILAISFSLNVWMVGQDPAATFYMPYTRFWELMMGAALAATVERARRHVPAHPADSAAAASAAATATATDDDGAPAQASRGWFSWMPQGRSTVPAEVLAWAGALLILAALLVVNENKAFPGWLALLPTAGACLLIAAGPKTAFNRLLLSSRPLVLIGLISYSLYLWHWPVLAFQRVLSPENPGRFARVIAVALSFALAWATYRLVEHPLRHARSSVALAGGLCVVMAAIGVSGWLVQSQKGFPLRAANERNGEHHRLYVESAALNIHMRQRQYAVRPCTLPASLAIPADWCATYGAQDAAETIVLWGDSYSTAWSPVFFRIADEQKLRVVRFAIGGCPPLVEMRRIDPAFAQEPCAQFGQAETVIEAIRHIKPSRVFVIARWSLYSPGKVAARSSGADVLATQLQKTIAAMPANTPVVLFRTAPVIRDEPARALLRGTKVEYTLADYQRREQVSNRAIDAAVKSHPGVSAFDPAPIFCRDVCPAVLNGTVLYRNATHLTAQAVMLAHDQIESTYFPLGQMAPAARNAALL